MMRNMKSRAMLAAAAAAAAACVTTTTTTMAFAPPLPLPSHRRTTASLPLHMATLAVDELSSMSKEEQLDALGLDSEEKFALGIDLDEVLECIGTREDLIAKFQAEIPDFSLMEVQSEVDKFLMDGEMLDLYIKYIRRKREDPNWEPIYAEKGDESNPFVVATNFASQYAIWIVGGIIVKDAVDFYLKKQAAEGGGGGGGGGEVLLVSSALDAFHHLTNTIMA